MKSNFRVLSTIQHSHNEITLIETGCSIRQSIIICRKMVYKPKNL